MKEDSIEETKKQLELILKVRKEQKEIIECAGGSCINCDPDIKALTESIDILSDYKRALKENEYMHNELDKQQTKINKYAKENEELKSNNEKYIIHLTDEQYKTVIENAQNDINQKLIQKVKDKIEELDIAILECEYSDDDSEEYKKEVEKDKLELLKQKSILQKLLE